MQDTCGREGEKVEEGYKEVAARRLGPQGGVYGLLGCPAARKNEGKRLGRLLDTCVNESECTDLKIGQEFDWGRNLYWSQQGRGARGGQEGRKKEKHVNTESRKVTRRSLPMESKQNVDETKMEM